MTEWLHSHKFQPHFCPEATEFPSLEAGTVGSLRCVLLQVVIMYTSNYKHIFTNNRIIITLSKSWRCFIIWEASSIFPAAEYPIFHLVLIDGHVGGFQYLVLSWAGCSKRQRATGANPLRMREWYSRETIMKEGTGHMAFRDNFLWLKTSGQWSVCEQKRGWGSWKGRKRPDTASPVSY